MNKPATKTSDPKQKTRSSARGSASAVQTEVANATHARPTLIPERRRTEVPGVYLNRDGAQVDEHGVLLTLRRVQDAEAIHVRGVLDSVAHASPAAFLRAVALDPTLPLHTRLSSAIAAAPYFDRKMPLALEGGDPSRPIKSESSVAIRRLQELEPAERKAALLLLERPGVISD